MSGMSYVDILERFHDHRAAITDLLSAVVAGLAEEDPLDNPAALEQAGARLAEHYPFLDLVYVLDSEGVQVHDNWVPPRKSLPQSGAGVDRSRRPYFRMARHRDEPVVTEPYLSSAGGHLCVSAALRQTDSAGNTRGYLVVDADLAGLVAYLIGDIARRRFQPFFKVVYSGIVVGLLAVVGLLLYFAAMELTGLWTQADETPRAAHLRPFGVIVFLTLSLAIFDLAKTILEEEVLTHKDIFRHSATRRTITRFIAAILIAVSIESLLLMFKAALGEGDGILAAVAMMATVAALLIALGVYVYLGSRAEVHLLAWHKGQRRGGEEG
jgi:hypothetical protein